MVNFTWRRRRRRSVNGNDVTSTSTSTSLSRSLRRTLNSMNATSTHEYRHYPLLSSPSSSLYVIVIVDRRWQLKMFDSILYCFLFRHSAQYHTFTTVFLLWHCYDFTIKIQRKQQQQQQQSKAYSTMKHLYVLLNGIPNPSEYIAF